MSLGFDHSACKVGVNFRSTPAGEDKVSKCQGVQGISVDASKASGIRH